MFTSPRKYPVLIAGMSFLLATTCLVAATKIEAPANAPVAAPLKPPPGGEQMMQLGRNFDRKVDGTAVVIMLVNADSSIAKSAQIIVDRPIEQIEADQSMFEAIGMKREDVPYTGVMAMQSPNDSERKVLAVYTESMTPGERFTTRLFTNTRSLDREIYIHSFPDLVQNGVPNSVNPWVLIDREGHVLRSGLESIAHDQIRATIEARFPGISTREVTVTPLFDSSNQPVSDGRGREVQLTSVWLAPGSPLPRS